MDKRSSLKQEQLEAALKLQEMGIDPDEIMVTYTPEEYAEMYNQPDAPHYDFRQEPTGPLPVSMLGSNSILQGYDLSVNAFANPYAVNVVDMYNNMVRKVVAEADESEYTPGQLARQINIQQVLAQAIQAAIEYYTEEFESDERAYYSAVNSMQRSELGSDMRHSKFVLDKIILTKDGNDGLTRYLEELLFDLRKR